MGRRPCCDKIGLKKGPWTADEDQKLRDFIQINGTKYCWRAVPQRAGLLRCGKSCRLRWANYLRPDLKNDHLSKKEENLVLHLHSQFGNKWSKIASHLPGRTDNYIKNYWHNHIKKNFHNMRIDSITHNPVLLPRSPTDDHRNKSRKKVRKSREELRDQHKIRGIDETPLILEEPIIPNDDNLNPARGNLTIDTAFSVDQIPMIQPHEIVIPPLSDHLPFNNCSPSSFPTPSTSTKNISSSTINLVCEKLKSLPFWHSNNPCKDYNGHIGCSDEGHFHYWDWLLYGFDIEKIDLEMVKPPPDDESHD